ncbi:MAG: serine hydrolase [Bacteroidetes bacterium]|nr:serine hydrolase [Bacteroidota bacterium]
MKSFFISFFLIIQLMQLDAQVPSAFTAPAYQDATRNERIAKTFPLVEQLYKKFATENHFPGYAFGIVVDGKLVYKGNEGYANLEEKIPASSTSMFRIASMSKSFTCMAILKLRDEGKLQLDDAVEKYIPALKGQGLTTDAPFITIRHLMSHSAGFPEDNPWGDRQLDDTEADLNTLIKKQLSFSNTAGVAYEYSNLGFAMLGYIIHKVSGMTYDVYIQKNILTPLGMNNTTYEYTTIPKDKFAFGYRYINNQWRKEQPLKNGIYGAMGGMITSIDMFSKYVAMHEAAWPERNGNETFPLKRSSIREMHQPARFIGLNPYTRFPSGKIMATIDSYSYGLHWMIDAENKKSIGHSGGLPGFGSNWRFLPEYGIGVILFANVTYAPTSTINLIVLDTMIQLAQLKPRQISVSPILAKRQKELAGIITHWNNKETIFAENFFDDYPIDALKKSADEIFIKVGKIKKVNEMVAENQLRGYCIIECDRGKLKLAFTLTPENPALVQEYHLTIENP